MHRRRHLSEVPAGSTLAAMRLPATLATVAVGFGILVSAAACSNSASPPPASRSANGDPWAVRVEGRVFRDGLGRQRLFHGYNAKVKGLFDPELSGGRQAQEEFPDLTEQNLADFEALGQNVLRIPINWSIVEPEPGQYNPAVLAKLDGLRALARKHGIHLLLDMHQDAYSKEIGQDGAPLWAIVPEPRPDQLREGPYKEEWRLDEIVINAGWNFFRDKAARDGRSLQDAHIAATKYVVAHVASDTTILGIEAFNEPVPPIVGGFTFLRDFHERFAKVMNAVDRSLPVFFEPEALRNQSDRSERPETPWAVGPGVYSPHIYTAWFTQPSQNNWESEDPKVLEKSMLGALEEAQAWQTPLFVTEFGCDQSIPRGPRWLHEEMKLQDRTLASATAWQREPGDWGIYDKQGVLRPVTAALVGRSWPRAIAGDLLAIERPSAESMTIRFRGAEVTGRADHDVSVTDAYWKTVSIACDGAPVTPAKAVGHVTFRCGTTSGEHTITLSGTVRDEVKSIAW